MHRGRGSGGFRRGGGGFRGGGPESQRGRGESDEEDSPPSSPTQRIGEREMRSFFQQVDGQNYARLKELNGVEGLWDGQRRISLWFYRIQSDPFAPGSQITVSLPMPGISQVVAGAQVRKVAVEDHLCRIFYQIASKGKVEILRPSQHVIERSTLRVLPGSDTISVNVRASLPGHGRRIDGRSCDEIMRTLVAGAQRVADEPLANLAATADFVEDQEWLRSQLSPNGLVAFVVDGAVLPRASGNSDRPLINAVPFASPDSQRCSFTLPRQQRTVCGMGIRKGITLIVGGGFHGKSTMLRALEVGVYNHVKGDGREFVVTDEKSVKIRAEDRRSVTDVCIAPFINNIPMGKSTTSFSTGDASGSTSQAANIMEALEMGASALLIDEDTSATNFMVRDDTMKLLVTVDKEPITPFVERAAVLASEGVSTVLVVGGSSAFLCLADTVLMLDSYKTLDVTSRAHELVGGKLAYCPPGVAIRNTNPPRPVAIQETFVGLNEFRAKCGGQREAIRLGQETVELGLVEQLVEEGQYNAIAMCLAWMHKNVRSEVLDVPRCVVDSMTAMQGKGLEITGTAYYGARGFVSMPRPFEVSAALNRMRTLVIRRK